MICGWDIPPPIHRTEQGYVGTLTMLWYNTYTKKALYCIEFRKGKVTESTPPPRARVSVCVCVCVCVCVSPLFLWRRGGVVGRYGPTTISEDIGNIPWKDPVVKHLTSGLFFFPSLQPLYFSFYFHPCPKNNSEFISVSRASYLSARISSVCHSKRINYDTNFQIHTHTIYCIAKHIFFQWKGKKKALLSVANEAFTCGVTLHTACP